MSETDVQIACYLDLYNNFQTSVSRNDKDDGIVIIAKSIINMMQKLKNLPDPSQQLDEYWKKVVTSITFILALYYDHKDETYIL